MTIDAVLNGLDKVRGTGHGKYVARCGTCGDLLLTRKNRHCNRCLAYDRAWQHIQKTRHWLTQASDNTQTHDDQKIDDEL